MSVFYSHWWAPGDSTDAGQPEDTDPTRLPHRYSQSFKTWDCSATEDAHWQRKLDMLPTLRTEFEAEGNIWLHDFRGREDEGHFARRRQRKCSHYLLHAWPGEA